VASFLCLEYAGGVALYNSGFDPAHASLAPGIVLLAHVIRDAIDRALPMFDFLRGEEPYKYAFGPTPEELFNVRVTA
jgi:CelD/BcsL family acetyltransferase involved in cellulose biosynthesis